MRYLRDRRTTFEEKYIKIILGDKYQEFYEKYEKLVRQNWIQAQKGRIEKWRETMSRRGFKVKINEIKK